MTRSGVFIDGQWETGSGPSLTSIDPSTGNSIWSGNQATSAEVARAIDLAHERKAGWSGLAITDREQVLRRFAELAEEDRARLRDAISSETGKPRWEADTEVTAVIGKVALSIEAYHERTPTRALSETAAVAHRPLGVMGVLGPFNFPAHLPNGQIVPALLAGNAIVYKPSELTPLVATIHVELLAAAGVPDGVLALVLGGRDTGEAVVSGAIDGLAFTGSATTGRALHRALAGRPEVLLALEMGGNAPLVVVDAEDLEATIDIIVRSAFLTTGQRCTCARRLFLPTSRFGDEVLDGLVSWTSQLRIGGPFDDPEPFAGPVISELAADRVRDAITSLEDQGGRVLTGPGPRVAGTGFIRPTIIECDGFEVPDDEVFGPLLTVHRFEATEAAFDAAAATQFGLAAGIITEKRQLFDDFRHRVGAGIVNWNAPTTGASGRLPFGGTGASGNHRPAGWYAADFCATPVASVTRATPAPVVSRPRGVSDESGEIR